jgi:microcompartment protein CcmK/EutM
MNLAKVLGSVVATRKEPAMDGLKLLMLAPADDRRRS